MADVKVRLSRLDGESSLPVDVRRFFEKSEIRESTGVREMNSHVCKESLRAKFKYLRCLGDSVSVLLNGGVVSVSDGSSDELKSALEDNCLVILGRTNYGMTSFGMQELPDQVRVLSDIIDEPEELITKILNDGTHAHYHTFFIWKDDAHTKKRWISAPDEDLKRIQRKILDRVIYKYYGTSPNSHGFVIGRSIKTNAMLHLNRKMVLKMDLRDFFPSFTREMVRGSLVSRLPKAVSKCFDTIIELCLLDGKLPQGAPTSPAIANIGASYMDLSFAGMAKTNNMTYTRYADDLVFSSDWESIGKIVPIVKRVASSFGFTVANHKIHILRKGRRQTVTGLVVNNDGFVSVPRPDRMKFRAKLHNIITGKTPIADVKLSSIEGYANFIAMANPSQAGRFNDAVARIKGMVTA